MALELYVNLAKYPTVRITPILIGKRYEPVKFNCENKEEIEALKEFIQKSHKKYSINYILSEKQITSIIQSKKPLLERIIDLL